LPEEQTIASVDMAKACQLLHYTHGEVGFAINSVSWFLLQGEQASAEIKCS
jgi:hypothetical protein